MLDAQVYWYDRVRELQRELAPYHAAAAEIRKAITRTHEWIGGETARSIDPWRKYRGVAREDTVVGWRPGAREHLFREHDALRKVWSPKLAAPPRPSWKTK